MTPASQPETTPKPANVEQKTVAIMIRLTPGDAARVQALADREYLTRPDLIRRIVLKECDAHTIAAISLAGGKS